jgi:hypothetical protein
LGTGVRCTNKPDVIGLICTSSHAGSFLHLPGSFSSCLEADAGIFRGQYCLLGMAPGRSAGQGADRAIAHLLNLPEARQVQAGRTKRLLQAGQKKGTVSRKTDFSFKGDFFLNIFYVLYLSLLHLPPLRFHCAEGCWDRIRDRCN